MAADVNRPKRAWWQWTVGAVLALAAATFAWIQYGPSLWPRSSRMVGCRWKKKFPTWLASFTLYYFAGFPVHDATNGVRIFSRRIIDTIEIESRMGFSYSFEMMVKVHRLRWSVFEFPTVWYERKTGESRFKIGKWMIPYLRWYFFAFATTWLRRGPESVRLNKDGSPPNA